MIFFWKWNHRQVFYILQIEQNDSTEFLDGLTTNCRMTKLETETFLDPSQDTSSEVYLFPNLQKNLVYIEISG